MLLFILKILHFLLYFDKILIQKIYSQFQLIYNLFKITKIFSSFTMKINNLTKILLIALMILSINSLYTKKIIENKYKNCKSNNTCTDEAIKVMTEESLKINITTQCNTANLSEYNYTGIVRSGYLSVGKGNSVLAFLFYGKKTVTNPSQLKNIPTIIWLNGGPGSSSQLGNMQELGPLNLKRTMGIDIVQNKYTWANDYNLLFVDQPVGTGLAYADQSFPKAFTTSMDQVAADFYYALDQLYNNANGCFNSKNLNIPGGSPLFIFGESYAGKYVPAISKKIVQMKKSSGFLTGLKGVAIGDGFTMPYDILSEVGTYSYHLSLLDYQERMKVQTMLLRAAKNNAQLNYDALHDDFDNALDYIVQKCGLNVYDIKKDQDYEELLQPYFRDPHNQKLYGLSSAIIYDSQGQDVYKNLYTDFMKPQVRRVEYLLGQGMPVLIYNGQDDLIVQTAGTMKWVDRISYGQIQQFRQKLFTPWKLNGKTVGSIKSAGRLQFRIVNNAGHMVPMDCPQAALDMVKSFVQSHR